METLQEQQQYTEQKAATETVDFKMVTFSLAGKEYGIDIMKVKEISKADRFTYVPNTSPYVRGVYNLRGDIISIIDLRVMFHLPAPSRSEGVMEDMIILRLDNYFIGVIVDSIDKVVGISSNSIQPPHPLFGDINIKFIKGIVENDKRLYIILDVDKILGESEEDEETRVEVMGIPMAQESSPAGSGRAAGPGELGLEFLEDTLKTFRRFTVSPVNRDWVKERYHEWKKSKGGSEDDAQLKSPEEADEFLAGFYSPHSGELWGDAYAEGVAGLLPQKRKGNLTAWNPGCGKGYETYSLTALLKERNPEAVLKVWANDNDLLSISTAPNLIVHEEDVPARLSGWVQETKTGRQFSAGLRDHILFEYHDVLHPNPFPDVDCIVARDIVSFMAANDQDKLLKEFFEKLKPEGILLLGSHETIDDPDWERIESSGVVAYRKKNG